MPVERIRAKFEALRPALDERLTRLWAGAEAEAIGEGGITIVARATGMSRTTIRAGRDELRKGATSADIVRVRRAGAGRRAIEDKLPGIVDALEGLIEPVIHGDRESPLRWTLKSTRTLSAELARHGFSISPQKVGQLLHARGYTLRSGGAPPGMFPPGIRHRQFELINRRVGAFQARNAPVISVEARYTRLTEDITGRGDERRQERTGDDADRELPAFVRFALTEWWGHIARRAPPQATELLIAVGGAWAPRWRFELQRFADHSGLTVEVSHVPLGTSRWARIEHRLLYHVAESWHDHCRRECEVAVHLIGSPRVPGRPALASALRMRSFEPPSGDVRSALITREGHAEWNYTLLPRTERQP